MTTLEISSYSPPSHFPTLRTFRCPPSFGLYSSSTPTQLSSLTWELWASSKMVIYHNLSEAHFASRVLKISSCEKVQDLAPPTQHEL